MCARTGLWEPWVSNHPGPPGLAITLIKNDMTRKDSIRAKRIRAGYDTDYLQDIINAIHVEN